MDHASTNLFDSVHPWTHSVHVLPNPLMGNAILDSQQTRITVVDSGNGNGSQEPVVVGIFIPKGRENDWLFTTVTGYKQLSEKYWKVSRLILIGNHTDTSYKATYDLVNPSDEDREAAEENVMPLLTNFLPRCFRYNWYKLPFLQFCDGLIHRQHVTGSLGPALPLGDFAVTDEVIRCDGKDELRRRLRFQKTGGWIHAEAVVVPIDPVSKLPKAMDVGMAIWGTEKFGITTTELVDAHSRAMIYGLKPIYDSLKNKSRKVLLLGASGLPLVNFLKEQLGFEVVCSDPHVYVIDSLKDLLHIHLPNVWHIDPVHILDPENNPLADGLAKFQNEGHDQFNVIMIDIKELEIDSYSGSCAPPRHLVTVDMLNKIKSKICGEGAVIFYVIPPDAVFYANVVKNLKKVFDKVYQITLSNDKHCVLVATSGPSGFPVFHSFQEAEKYDQTLLKTSIPAFVMDEM